MRFFTSGAILSLAVLTTGQLSAAPIVEKIAPKSTSCDAANEDCRTGEQAAPWIALGMWQYRIFSTKEMAAIISVIAFESGDFQYKHNLFPGRPGQGTSNMQMAEFNLAYAKQIPELKEKAAKYDSTTGLSDDQLNEILSWVTPDEYNFASGAWYYSEHCDDSVSKLLNTNPDKGYEAYLTECIGTTVTDDRLAYWDRAKEAFGFN
ncbi:Fc.00g026000.m01.CDS01 [Cosmosporella sp. VM-42]